MDREELLRLYAGGEKDFTGQSFGGLRNQRIRQGIYRETDFSEQEFDGGHFREVDLSFANFRRVRMFESSFRNCYMEGIDFSNAVFGQVLFNKVDLSRAIFRNAVFEEAGFSRANLSYVDLRGARKLIIESCKNVIFYKTIMPDGSIRSS